MTGGSETRPPTLSVESVTAGYGHVGVLEDVSLDVSPASIVALLGRNGAGKSTLLRVVSGLIPPSSGRVVFEGRHIGGKRPDAIVDAGLLHVAEGRRLFRSQTVADNLELGRYGLRISQDEYHRRLEPVYEMFPILHERRATLAGALSGGQQQMLAIAQAVIRRPKLLMLDEPSLGLAPLLVDQVLDAIVALRKSGVAILLVEQMVERALEIADRAFVLQNGRMIASGTADDIARGEALRAAYMGA